MKSAVSPRSTRVQWRTFGALCGTILAVASPVRAQEQRIGAVVGVPVAELPRFLQANAYRGVDRFGHQVPSNSVRTLHVSPEAGGRFGTVVVTVSVTPYDPNQPSGELYFPLERNGEMSPLYREINAWDSYSSQEMIGLGERAVMRVDVVQSGGGLYLPTDTRFMMAPAGKVISLYAINPEAKISSVHLQRTAIGSTVMDVELVAIDPASARSLKIPGADLAGAILALNTHVAVQSTQGSGDLAVTTVAVGR